MPLPTRSLPLSLPSTVATAIAFAFLVGVPTSADAVVKVYDATPPNGTPGDVFLFTITLCPPVEQTPGNVQGRYVLDDAATGTVTASSITIEQPQSLDLDLLGVYGPGAFVFIDGIVIAQPNAGQTGVGSTSPGSSVDWGVIGGCVRSGCTFCTSSPATICTAGVQVPHGITVPTPPAQSPTYDLGTWSFDAEGDMEAATPYIFFTSNGGTSNGQYLLRGAFVGGSVPALPLVGAGALAIALAVVGVRAGLRRS